MGPEVREAGAMFAAGIIVLVLLHRYVYMPAALALFRQEVFAVRRRLFLLGAESKIASTHPVYTHLRTTMNRLLRFAERVTLARILFTMWTSRSYQQFGLTDRLLADIEDVELRKAIDDIRTEMGLALFFHLLRTSPIAWIVASIVAVAKLVTVLSHWRWRDAKHRIGGRLEPVAEALTSEPRQGHGRAA